MAVYQLVVLMVLTLALADYAFGDGACDSSPCQNGATCRQNSQSFWCNCPRFYYGKTCDKVSPCKTSNPCKNNGKCRPSSWPNKGYRCRCQRGYFGFDCEKESPCRKKPSPCENGGQCVMSGRLAGGYFCRCLPTTRGRNCQHINPCNRSDRCLNGGKCKARFLNNSDGFRISCECTQGWTGKYCGTRS